MSIDESIYRVRMFQRVPYTRMQCKYCRTYFWSMRKRDDCGDAPCTDYTFFDIPTKRFLSYREVRDLFLDFFKRHGHEIVEPRPVVARWREDLYLTIASIVVFQPHVTSGIVPPPANPLVIAQPCIRLEDIDNVGLTFGRHLTNFIMGGHHAFNYPDKRIYWTDETVEYAKEFFTKEIGIPEDELTYKESWWEGGGNAGPCFEVAVGGLELATLVFMMYKVENGSYSEIPIKIVDTGYGIERIAWFVQKTPTAFHAVYGPLVQEFHKALGILEPDKDLLYIAARLVARLQPSKPNALDEFFNNVASVLGIDKQEVENQLRPAIDVYALLDHTKTIALMLTDGIVPSNSGEGYLARLVIRRSLRRLHKISKDIRLSELVAKQLDYWSDMYPNMKKNKDRILEMVILEEEKFLDVVKKLSTIVVKYAKKVPTLEDLVLLYDSQGIPPDMLRDELERRYKVRIEIPQNFYSIVASRHSKPVVVREIEEKKKLRDDVVSWASKFPETRRLFHEDPYIRIFKAKVLGVYENYLILDSTAFYPEGGGQLGDRGFIIVNGKKIKVIDTQKTNGVVVHILERPLNEISVGQEVIGEIDWITRYRRMRHHTATHILLGALRRILGEHVWQAGAEKTIEKGRLDITHYRMLTGEEIKKIEELANKIVDERIDLRFNYLGKFEAEKKYGTKIYQGGAIISKTLRIVEIPGWDAEACYGTHLHNTGEVGGIKIINVEKIQDGVIRLEYIAGTRIPEYSYNLENIIEKIASMIKTSPKQILPGIEKFYDEYIETKEILSRYREKLMKLYEDRLTQELIEVCGYKIIYLYNDIGDHRFYRDLALNISRRGAIIFYDTGKYIEVFYDPARLTRPIDLRTVLNELIKKYPNIRGGGKQDHITFRSNISSKELFNSFRRILSEMNSCEEN